MCMLCLSLFNTKPLLASKSFNAINPFENVVGEETLQWKIYRDELAHQKAVLKEAADMDTSRGEPVVRNVITQQQQRRLESEFAQPAHMLH